MGGSQKLLKATTENSSVAERVNIFGVLNFGISTKKPRGGCKFHETMDCMDSIGSMESMDSWNILKPWNPWNSMEHGSMIPLNPWSSNSRFSVFLNYLSQVLSIMIFGVHAQVSLLKVPL